MHANAVSIDKLLWLYLLKLNATWQIEVHIIMGLSIENSESDTKGVYIQHYCLKIAMLVSSDSFKYSDPHACMDLKGLVASRTCKHLLLTDLLYRKLW